MNFLVPLFLAGGLLLALPILIHKIRRPERSTLKFSSLMFVPAVKKEVIERRKIQHLLLLLLRLAIFAILVLAFSRPYWLMAKKPGSAGAASEYHLILIDTSASMQVGSSFEQAQTKALSILDDLSDTASVGIISFDTQPRLLAPLASGQEAKTTARSMILALKSGQASTNYLPAMRKAEEAFLGFISEQNNQVLSVLHLISDFRQNGLPDNLPAWRLSGRIRFKGYQVGPETFLSAGISDIVVRKDPGKLTLFARVKNYEPRERAIDLKLQLEGKPPQQQHTVIPAGNASLVSFPLDPNDVVLQGQLSLPPDAYPLDDTRYLFWQEKKGKRVWLVGPAQEEAAYGSSWFFAKALQTEAPLTWEVRSLPAAILADQLKGDKLPDVLVINGVSELSQALGQALKSYLQAGGQVVLCQADPNFLATWNRNLFEGTGMSLIATNQQKADSPIQSRLAWINFDHPVFFDFRGAQYNDFSGLSFQNALAIKTLSDTQILAKRSTETGELLPIMAEQTFGKGRLIVWAFAPRLDATNLPKHPKFVPLVQETLSYLTRSGADQQPLLVGQSVNFQRLLEESPQAQVQVPSGKEFGLQRGSVQPVLTFEQAGFVKTRTETSEAWRTIDAVNGPAQEGDPAALSTQEFALKMTSNHELNQALSPSQVSATNQSHTEFGYWIIALLLPLLILETLYAAKLSAPARTSAAAPQGALP